MHRRVTVVERADTILVPDTVVAASLVTTVDDGWVRTRLSLSPGRVAVSGSVRNETTIVVASRRETVRPPRRIPLFRLFQRKQTVVTVTAVDGNPWCVTRESRSVGLVPGAIDDRLAVDYLHRLLEFGHADAPEGLRAAQGAPCPVRCREVPVGGCHCRRI